MAPRLLKRAHVESGLEVLGKKHKGFARVIQRLTDAQIETLHQTTPAPNSAFTSLTRSICSQQLSTKAARTIFSRVQRLVPAQEPHEETHDVNVGKKHNTTDIAVCPHAVHAAAEEDLRQAGLSTNKIRSIKDLASRFVTGTLSDDILAAAEDIDELEALLLDVKGIGPWTVQMFAIFFLRFPDVPVTGDLGVRKGYAKIFSTSLPSPTAMEKVVISWAPYRSLGAHLCWKALDMDIH